MTDPVLCKIENKNIRFRENNMEFIFCSNGCSQDYISRFSAFNNVL